MAVTIRFQAVCVLLLLLASLTSGSALQDQTGQLADYRAQGTTEAKAGLMAVSPGRGKRDTHFPICVFCCGCCSKSKCGICCKT
ncbi:hepcidin [Tenrec ecaudatus]|uniref:hepcidin n=1 Tax=Tenrec ecaudatus TaxID=94439 RepID=UPI003F591850